MASEQKVASFADFCQTVQTYLDAYEADIGEKPSAVRLCSKHINELQDYFTSGYRLPDTHRDVYSLKLLGKPVAVEVLADKQLCYVCDVYVSCRPVKES